MFEAHVLHLLRRYLGEYVHGLSAEALRISVWKGDVVLKDLKLKAEALNSLKLPVTVKAGFVGTITLKVPWKSLGKEPVIVLIDRVFVLAQPPPDGRSLKEEDREKLFEAKLQQIEEAESATLEAISRSKLGSPPAGNSWLGSLIGTIIGNLKISISNVHVRYEDSVSNPGHPFSCGVTLAKLAAVTMDEQGNETFDTSGALDRLRKSLQVERLAMYHDSNCLPWKLDKKWEDLSPKEWVEIFEVGINESASDNDAVSVWAQNRNYLVSPINGVLKYHRLGNQERNDPGIPFEKASLDLTDVSLTITEAQYHDWIRLLEAISRYKTYVEVSHLRPVVSVSEAPRLWWRYAAQATLQQKKVCYRFSWDQIHHLCQLRRRYIQLYAGSLQQLSNVNISEIRDIEKDLDPKVTLLWRFLAHAKVESVKSKEAAEQRMLKKKGWFPFRWYTPGDASVMDASGGSESVQERLTKEEWQAINNLLSYQPAEDLTLHFGKDSQNMIHFLVNISIGQAAARIVNINQTEIVCGRFEQLLVSTKFKHRSTHCDVTLRFYGLSAPEGSLVQSVSSEQKVNALSANFVRSPVGENVDWRLSATISPCHVTVLMESYNRFLEFVKRSNAVSPTVALETATVLQNKIDMVTRRAQEQFQIVLEEQSRFALDIDLDAPKVRVPIRTCGSSKCDCHFLLDFGHFTLYTKGDQLGDQGKRLYSRFYISGRDIAAFFTGCGYDSQSCALVSPVSPMLKDSDNLWSLIDRCGMAVIVDQIKVPHPSYPSTRVSVQVPSLGIHFSPARYCRLMELFNILYGTTQSSGQPELENFQADFVPWNSPDLATEARILVWRGIGYSVAAWHPCFIVLTGLYLYVLESEMSQNYQRCSSMAGKQVYEVPPMNVGGSVSCLAVSVRGMDTQKALESFSTLVIEFQDEEEKGTWLRGLMQATYRASAPSSVNILGDSDDGHAEFSKPHAAALKPADLVINGALVETKLSLYGKIDDEVQEKLEETRILEILAGGGKVHVIRLEGDLTVKMKLHSLKIKDELQGSLSSGPKYLACSVLKNDPLFASPSTLDPLVKEVPTVISEEDDIFKDALPDFMSLPDYSQNFDMAFASRSGDISEYAEFDSVGDIVREKEVGKGKSTTGDVFYEAEGSDNSDFVSVTYSTRNPSSPDYDGIDAQMSIRMSKLEFFCNRPTVVALIGFGFNLSSATIGTSDTSVTTISDDQSLVNKDKTEETGHAFVKGLLGYGKGRIVFYLNLDVDSVSVFLNKEDGSQLAMFVQESFVLDLKLHPSSISIEGTLGNFRLCDMSLGMDHRWGWLCDIRNQGAESLIKFSFNSYSAEDDDYEGYDYSLQGRVSAVRIVFLYRFVQEITAYFMELATPHTEEAIKLVDKVGGFEWLINKYEIDGSSALKLDLSLDTPIIIVPRNSMSKDFMQLDLGQLQVRNAFSWHGCPEKDPSAVHLDVLDAEILGINMAVGINGCIGKPMIRDGQGINVYVRRSLRDVFRKVPTFSLGVKVGLLHAVMSDKEYNVILDCFYMNLSEQPKLPPSFRGSKSGSKETMRLLADKVNINSQILLSHTVTIIAVEVDHALLELCSGVHEDSPLAHVALEGLWVSYRMTSLSEADLYVTIPRFYVLDIRPDTKPEMRLMLGSCTDVPKQASTGKFPFSLNKGGFMRMDSQAAQCIDVPTSTMFLMDYRWRLSSQSFVVRIQQPRVLVVPDFLLAVGEYFVPSLGAITGREELMDPKNDPTRRNNSIVLSAPVYEQIEDIMHLSPNRQLVADALGVDEYTYNGCGKTIHLSEEPYLKEVRSSKFRPIIILGRGKRLRFVNVKIENGSLLRKYTYLNNDSSYSVSLEDGVEILLLDNFSSNSDEKNPDCVEELSCSSNTSTYDNDSFKMQSFTFEAQVVSPEFTFYDSSKSSLDDSSHGEKLLRAKMDFSFMYASKENDTWIRTLVKDLTVEAGSGLIVLDPVDISGGYTSVNDKTNVSLVSTDIYIHLSLSVISLLLNLQTQAALALQLGNTEPMAPCTNFDRLWVSPKENSCHNNLTFWRPRAPSNYVILGDCVTSRPIPPSQAVLAVSNTYGRVRKPLGFKLIGLFSDIQGLEAGEGQSDVDGGCSLWIPVAPPGYLALGCVAHKGSHPPPNHIVHCIRSDLVTFTTYSECIFSASSNRCFTYGFSIWRSDNVLGSFYAHPSDEYPPKDSCYDLNHLLLWNSSWHSSSTKKPTSNQTTQHEYVSQQSSNQSASSSGWDVLRSFSKATNCYMSTPNFERIWWDKGCDIRRPVSIWRPIPRPGYAILGDCITEGLEPPALGIIFRADNPEISAKPVQFTKVAHIVRKGLDEAFFWYPIAPPGYASLGCVVSRIDEAPLLDLFCCPRMDLVHQANILEVPISRSLSSKGSQCWSIWKVENQACTFLARCDLKKPSSRLAFTIGDSVKPKTRENITSEMKIRCFSVTVLDSLCRMMTPLFDATITNIKLATHGRLEAMNAVLISSIAASTFNKQLEAWEPLVEPFDGIFKFETYDTNLQPPSRLGKRARVAATSILNINLSAANLDTFAETMVSWRRQRELEQKAMKFTEEAGTLHGHGDNLTFAALDEDDFQTVIVENKLGCDIYLRKVEQNSNTIDLLCHGECASVWVPPPRYSDRLNVADESREARRYVAVQILEAKGLSIIDDGNSHNFFCALRLIVDSQEINQQKLFPQSARTKCVKPLTCKTDHLDEGTAKWNELFIFEVPRKGIAKLEVEVTNLAAKAGKGEVVGASSFSVGHGANTLKKVASVRMLHQPPDGQHIVSYPLKTKGQPNCDDINSGSCLLVSTSYFERKAITKFQSSVQIGNDVDRDVGFWVGLGPKGEWESFRSFLPLTVITKSLNDDFVAVEVVMRNGKKHAIFRGLASVANDSGVKLDVSVCPISMINSHDLSEAGKKKVMGQSITSMNDVVGTISPGSSVVLPWRSLSKDSDHCLQVRPCFDHPQPPYSWGYAVAVGSGYTYGKDQPSIDQGLFSRQNTLKQGNKMPVSSLKLNQLEKKDILLCCPSTGRKQFWLSISTDASVLQTELNAPVYDWKISINSPLKLENRLPCPAEFTVWEKLKEGNSVERQHGIIPSRGSVHIYSADVRKPIYLSLFVQGGWVLEKDPVLVLDLTSTNHASSFWMVHQQRKRRLRVSIERDMGGTAAAPKTIRFFVPYWISNESSLSLGYRVVEIEPLESVDAESLLPSKSFKSAKTALRSPTNLMDRRPVGLRKDVQVLEAIEDTSPTPSMLSPQDYVGRGGVMLFSTRNDAYLSPRVGIAVAIRNSEFYSPGISLLELEKKQRVVVKAFNSDGSYYKLSAMLQMTSDRTKVVHFQPHTLFLNRVGRRLSLQQCDTQMLEWIQPTDPPRHFGWQPFTKLELLKVRLDGYEWSTPFSVETEGLMCVSLKNETKSEQIHLRVEVRSGTKCSHYEVIFRPNSLSSPYRIENRSLFLPVSFRQVDGTSDSWRSLLPNSAASFLWEDLGRRRLLELLVDGTDPLKSQTYNIDEISDHQPIHVAGGPSKALRVSILKEEKTNVVKLSDWMPENDAIVNQNVPSSLSQLSGNDFQHRQSNTTNFEFHVIIELAELGLSIIDHTPEEILYMSVQNLLLSYSTGLDSGISRLKVRMRGIQVDNQLPLTPMPVLFRPQRVVEETDYILKFSMTQQSNGSLDLCVYPYIGFQGPENSAFLINIHEPIIWRLHGMVQHVNLNRLYDSQSNAVSFDPIIQICVLNISEVRFKVSMTMSPTQRPVGVLGFWSSLMTALGNTENMPVRINQRFQENVCTRQTVLISNAILNIKKDLLSQPFQLLSGVDILGNASSALGHMSKGVAALSMDKKFIQSRQRQENKGVEDFGDVIREGGGALAKGLFRGVTGILTKPLEGAKASGVEGFVQGVGKGIIGAAAQPVSGVLDLLSKTTEGANAMRMKIASAITSEDQLLRRRLPRVISGDSLLRPYDEYKAEGQVILQLAESGLFFGQVDLFKVRAKFALSDAYEDHFSLPKSRILVVTHRRIILLQQTSNIIAQKKFNPARDPCSVLWDVLLDDLVTMELTHGKKDRQNAPPSRLIIYLQTRSAESKEPVRVIKCYPESNQAFEVYSSIDQAMNTYGPSQSKATLKRKVTKPYSPIADISSAEVIPKEVAYMWPPQHVPASVPLSSTFGSSVNLI
ncbi:putative vacuolar protein sorting-associated protein 13A [Camellia lanceoleosa]|uniref:Vacuolar protein sorting-associated protein 13A n=1 Tax=Camellia lanceoleosa TaxID=1840588 RepID=A0ACC0FYR6_9ERIC|nr:putative vacuolar protein sorting-associated protein 13A [Camellia lanceoleosa]